MSRRNLRRKPCITKQACEAASPARKNSGPPAAFLVHPSFVLLEIRLTLNLAGAEDSRNATIGSGAGRRIFSIL